MRFLNLFSTSVIYTGLLGCSLLISSFLIKPYDTAKPDPEKPRLLVLTDINSLDAKVLEADDAQSMIRLMLYTNQFDIEGLIASSKLTQGVGLQPQLIHAIIDAYGKVQPNLLKHDPAYPSASHLHTLVKSGHAHPVPRQPVTTFTSFGAGRDTEGSDWIIRTVDQPDPRPIWICIWGGAADLAQALWKVQQTRPKEALQTFVRKLRVRAISDQDSTGGWIVRSFPDLAYVKAQHNYRGMYRGGNTKLNDSLWVATYVHNPTNPLGMLYPNYVKGDIFSKEMGPQRFAKGIKEGDTPSFLTLIPNGLNQPERPELGGWGGLFIKTGPNDYVDKIDSIAGFATDRTPYMASVHRWRADFQADFQARLDWCVKPYNQANHRPNAVINGTISEQPIEQTIVAEKSLTFDAGKSSDPDGNSLRYQWQIYPQSTHSSVRLQNSDSAKLTVHVDSKASPQLIPILLTVTDNGQPTLRHYRRVLLQIHSR